jgi:hypothetical protein
MGDCPDKHWNHSRMLPIPATTLRKGAAEKAYTSVRKQVEAQTALSTGPPQIASAEQEEGLSADVSADSSAGQGRLHNRDNND